MKYLLGVVRETVGVALTITPTQVKKVSGVWIDGVAGEAVARGKPVYQDSVTKKFMLCDTTSETKAQCKGIAMNDAADGQPVKIQTEGRITLGAGAAMTVGDVYCVGDVAGSIVPDVDLSNNDWVCDLGRAITAADLILDIRILGAQAGRA